MGELAVVCSLSTLVDIWKYVHSFRTASKSVRWWCVLLNRTFQNIHHRSYDMLWYIYYFVRWPGCFIHFYSKRQKQLACLSLVGGWQPSTQHNNKIKIFKFLKKKRKQQQQQKYRFAREKIEIVMKLVNRLLTHKPKQIVKKKMKG